MTSEPSMTPMISRSDYRNRSVFRGEIFYIKEGAFIGSEQGKARPAIVVSNNKNNENSPTIEVVYLTTSHKKELPTHFIVTSAKRPSIALCEQITTVDKSRLENYVGKLDERETEDLNRCMKISLSID